jgi:hypothetical protein
MKTIFALITGVGILFLSSCTDYGYYGSYSTYGSSSAYNSVSLGFVSTEYSRWAYDPYCRSYYDHSCGRYYNHHSRCYYTSKPHRYSSPVYPHGYRHGRRLSCPTYLPRHSSSSYSSHHGSGGTPRAYPSSYRSRSTGLFGSSLLGKSSSSSHRGHDESSGRSSSYRGSTSSSYSSSRPSGASSSSYYSGSSRGSSSSSGRSSSSRGSSTPSYKMPVAPPSRQSIQPRPSIRPSTPAPRIQSPPSGRLEVARQSSSRTMRTVPTSIPTSRSSRSSSSSPSRSSSGGRSGGRGGQ